jgi:hypothetical protein
MAAQAASVNDNLVLLIPNQLRDFHAIALKAASGKKRNDSERNSHLAMNRGRDQKNHDLHLNSYYTEKDLSGGYFSLRVCLAVEWGT